MPSSTHFLSYRLLGLVLTGLLLTAATCEKEVQLDFEEEEPRLVVVSNFTPGEPLDVLVSRTESVFLPDTSFVAISDAVVEVFEGDRFIEKLEFVEQQNGVRYFYRSKNFKPEVGVNYTLKAEAFGMEAIFANNSVPEAVQLDEIEVDNVQVKPSEDNEKLVHSFRVRIAFDDPLETENFYHLILTQQRIIYQDGKGTNFTNPRYRFEDRPILVDPINNNNSLNAYLAGGVLIADREYNGERIGFSFNLEFETDRSEEVLGKLKAEFRTVTEDYYRYYSTSSNQARSSGVPFSEPVFVHNNIENGYGVFAGYNTYTDSLDVAQ